MKRITDFLAECGKCNLNQPLYNGYSDSYPYWEYITGLYDNAVASLIEIEIGIDRKEILYKRILEVKNSYFDFPTNECIERLKLDYEATLNKEILNDYNYLQMAKQCVGYQRYYLNEFEKYFKDNIEDKEEHVEKQTDIKEESKSLKVEGIRGLAEYLGCGVNTAQKICNSGILKQNNIQYSVGRKYVFNCEKLNEFLSKNPDAFDSIK